MAVNEQAVTLDVTKPDVWQLPELVLRQGDMHGKTLIATITDNGEPFNLAGYDVYFDMQLPDKATYYRQRGEVDGNTVTVTIDETKAGAVVGETKVAYIAIEQDGELIASTGNLLVTILKNAKNGAVPAESWTSDIDEALEAIETATETAQGAAAAADEARQSAEQAAVDIAAETVRQQAAYQQAESARGSAYQAAEKARDDEFEQNEQTRTNQAVQAAKDAVDEAVSEIGIVKDANYVHTDNNYTTDEKAKLAAIEEGANNFELQVMSKDVLGGATLGQGLTVDGGALSIGDIVTDETDGPIYSVDAKGWAEQDGTPTPDNPVEVRVARGRNLLEIPSYDTMNLITVAGGYKTLQLQLAPNTDYYLSTNAKNGYSSVGRNVVILISSTSNRSIYIPIAHNTQGNKSGKLTTGENGVLYFGMSSTTTEALWNEVFDNTDVQLELGTNPTPYVPYGHVGLEVRDSSDELVSVTPIPLPSKGFAAALPDGTADSLAIDSAGGYEWGAPVDVVDLGTLTWNYVSGGPYFYAVVSGKKTGVFNILSEPFATASRAGAANLQNGEIVGANGDTAIYVKNTSYSDAASFKASLSGEMLYYQLATPATDSAYIDLPNIPEGATITCPELREVGVKCFVPGARELAEHADNWGKRCKEAEDRIAALEAAIANLATS